MAVIDVPVGAFDSALVAANPGDTLRLSAGDHGQLDLAGRHFDPPITITSAWYASRRRQSRHAFNVRNNCPTSVQSIGYRGKHGGFKIVGFKVDGLGVNVVPEPGVAPEPTYALDATDADGLGVVFEALYVAGAGRAFKCQGGGPITIRRCLFGPKPSRLVFAIAWESSPAGGWEWIKGSRIETSILLPEIERGIQFKPGGKVPPKLPWPPVEMQEVVACTIMTSGHAFGDGDSMDEWLKEEQPWRIGCLMEKAVGGFGERGQWAGCISRQGDPVPGRKIVSFTLDASYRPVSPPPELLDVPDIPAHPWPTVDFYGNPYRTKVAGAVSLEVPA